VRQSNNLVEAVRVSAGRGVAKMKSGSLSKTSRKNSGKGGLSGLLGGSTQTVDAEDEAEEEGGQDSDEEFLSLPQEQRRPAVWELYTRPSQAALEELEAANASKTSLGSVGNKDLTTTTAAAAIAPLRRQPSSGAKSVRSQGSQGSLRSGNLSTTSLALGSGSGKGSLIYNLKASQSTGSLLSLTRKRGHTKNSGSVTSLESIPEAGSPPPLPLPRGPLPYNWTTPPPTQTNGVSSAGSGGGGGSGSGSSPVTSRTKKAPALPPRLSLHQADSSDLSLWSEALLSGISLSGDGDLGLSFGLTPDKGKEKEKEKGKRVMTTAKPSTRAPPTQPLFQAPTPSVQPQPQPQPQPQKKSAPSNRPTAALRKAGQPLPSSKPPPSRPIPPIVHNNTTNPAASSTATGTATGGRSIDQKSGSGSGSAAVANGASSKSGLGASSSVASSVLGSNANNNNYSPAPMSGIAEAATSVRFMPVTPAPFSPAVFSPPPPLAMADKTLPLLVDATGGGGVVSPVAVRKPPATVPQGNGLLSPPPTAWSTSADPAFSPSGGSSAGPDSAQLWNEIEQMMDPTMMSAIPGLNLGVALPPGAQGVLRSAGVMVPAALPLPPLVLVVRMWRVARVG
jgi:hypothetical protein